MTGIVLADVVFEALKLLLLLSFPILLMALMSGILSGVLSLYTRLSEPAIGFMSRAIIVLCGLLLLSPWIADQVMLFTRSTWALFDMRTP